MSFIFRPGGTKQAQLKQVPYYTAFNPRSIGTCALWLDGADPNGTGVRPSNGTTITTWIDKSGTSNHGISGTATFQTDSYGGYINFTGSQSYTLTNSNGVVNQYFTIFVAEQLQNYAGGETGFMGGTTANGNQNLHMRYYGSSGIKFGFYGNDLDGTLTAFTNNTTQPIRVWSFSFTASSRVIYLNGTSLASDANNTYISGWSGAKIGSILGGQFYTGRMREVMIYSGTVSTTQRHQIESYLAQKWVITTNLPSDHLHSTKPAGRSESMPARKLFIYTVKLPPLYAFTSFTFTNAGATLQTGPTLSQCRTAYAGTSWLSQYFTMTTQGYQLWTVPDTATYTIVCAGAATNIPTNGFGYGVIVATTISLLKGQQIQILVGQMGDVYPNYSSCGGGGSFVASGLTPLTGVCLVAAGGGGGFQYIITPTAIAQNGTINTSGNTVSGIAGGTAGGGGAAGVYYTQGGAGFIGNGSQPTNYGGASPPLSFKNGGTGGLGGANKHGGFGGGGGINSSTGGGGGGGYSGGAGPYYSYGGGGGSFPSGMTLIGYNPGQGFVSVYTTIFTAVPTGGSISISALSSIGVTLIFTGMTNAFGYNYYITTSASSIASPIYSAFTISPGTFAITVTIPPGATYYAALIGVNTVGSSSTLFSSGYIFPGIIATVTLSNISSTGGTLTWTTSTLATGYNWYVGTGYGTGVIASGIVDSSTTTVNFTYSLTNSYYYGWVQPTTTGGSVLGPISYSPNQYYSTATGVLYSFTSFTFTNAGATGRFGPTLAQCQTAYSGTPWLTSYFTMTTQGYQLWTVPTTGTYTIVCAGAASSINPFSSFGYGAIIATTVSLIVGQQVQILVGHMGITYNANSASGGGGTFFASGTVPAGGSCLVAGGGGGGWGRSGNTLLVNGSSTTNGNASSDGYAGGTNGSGGAVPSNWAFSGAGFIGNGSMSANFGANSSVSLSFKNGGTGSYDANYGSVGSFGGGGGPNYGYTAGAGGGGYSGGASPNSGSGGGGGSFPTGATLLGYNQGQGFVYVYAGTYSSVPTGGSVSLSSFSTSAVTMTITAAINALVYNYYITTSGSSIASPLISGTTTITGTPFTISLSFTPGSTYYAAVVAKNTVGSGSIVFTGAYDLPGETIVGFTSISTSSITLSWTAATNAVSYAWSISTAASGGTVLASGTTSSLTTGAVSVSLSAGTNYYGRVIPSSSSAQGGMYVTGGTQTSGRAAFTYVGYMQAYTVPSGRSSVTVTLTGGGGGGGGYNYGGAGAYVNGTMAVTEGTTYYILVGGGGKGSNGSLQSTVNAFGGGGIGYIAGVYAGGGGGRSAIQATLGTDYVDAGGGGGSGYGVGGAGGAVGSAGASSTGGLGGPGGTLTGGPSYQGGNGLGYLAGGGGGGYQGGGGGLVGSNSGAGGGGSSLTTNLTGVTVTTGGGGIAGTHYQNGGDGTVTIV